MICLLGWVWGGIEALGKGLHRDPPPPPQSWNPKSIPTTRTQEGKGTEAGEQRPSGKTENISPCSPALCCNSQTGPPALVEMSQLGFRDASYSFTALGHVVGSGQD